uniref:mitochondrial mRNA pseudouridine synthase RPUSD3 n=1 Tax=Jaculus jaculus TaxID=51337 RepID=UPI001E1B5A27|nr:mitochondrial mRNA pseudouridine synthase RPUSD3 [Jaculus jaculus]
MDKSSMREPDAILTVLAKLELAGNAVSTPGQARPGFNLNQLAGPVSALRAGAGRAGARARARSGMGTLRVWRGLPGGWLRGLGLCAPLGGAGFSSETRRPAHARGSRRPTGPAVEQPFPGRLRTETLGREELVDALRAAVVDREGPLLTLNKPQGLPVTGKPGELTLLSVLPQLSQSLGLRERELQVVRAPEKEASGLVLLSSCPQTASHLQKFFSHSRRAQRPTATYCAVTYGIPAPREGKISVALKLECLNGINLQQDVWVALPGVDVCSWLAPQAVPVESPSRKDTQKGIKKTISHFHVMATGHGCALVQLQPLTVFPNQLQVHMVLQLCPLLGDHTYAVRMGTVLGQRILLPAESTKPQRQVLDEILLRRLHLTPSQAAQMPLHLHLHCLLLPGTRSRGATRELLAPPPPYFSRTLQCLQLSQQ